MEGANMYCSNCGTKNENSVNFCENCGFPIKSEELYNLELPKPVKQKTVTHKWIKYFLFTVIPISLIIICLVSCFLYFRALYSNPFLTLANSLVKTLKTKEITYTLQSDFNDDYSVIMDLYGNAKLDIDRHSLRVSAKGSCDDEYEKEHSYYDDDYNPDVDVICEYADKRWHLDYNGTIYDDFDEYETEITEALFSITKAAIELLKGGDFSKAISSIDLHDEFYEDIEDYIYINNIPKVLNDIFTRLSDENTLQETLGYSRSVKMNYITYSFHPDCYAALKLLLTMSNKLFINQDDYNYIMENLVDRKRVFDNASIFFSFSVDFKGSLREIYLCGNSPDEGESIEMTFTITK